MRRFLSAVLLACIIAYYGPSAAHAEDASFNNDYNVEYFLNDTNGTISSKVQFSVKITNLKSDVFVDKLSLAFPKTFAISNLKASDERGSVSPEVSDDGQRTVLTASFNNPAIGRNTVNTLKLDFDQSNLFKVNGNVWEVMLPTIDDKTRTSYKVVVHLPPTAARKIAIAKPKPDSIDNGVITWNNPTSRTIYAVFGDEQYYKVNLQYHLKNPKSSAVFTEIALPPDTLYQKTYINSLNPPPAKTYTDDDGNFMARYLLEPNSTVNVVYDATVSLFTKPRPETEAFIRGRFTDQKKYLLSPSSYWDIDNSDAVKEPKNALSVYSYVTKSLSYNYAKLSQGNKRMGAKAALANPTQAVCVEFTDAFVALARDKGIYAREIEGYGFSQDPQLRPLSFVSDVLHSWPEYYDEQLGIWIPVDPTWENTSGIDYFSSFDLDHITFAIHGKEPNYPLPAGMYKTGNSKDVFVTAVTAKPVEKVNVSVKPIKLPAQLSDNAAYKTTVTVVNSSNVYLWDTILDIKTSNMKSSQQSVTIHSLAPYEEKEIPLELMPSKTATKTNASLSISVMNTEVFKGVTSVVPYYFQFGLKIAYVVLGFCIVFLAVKAYRRMRS